MFKMRLKVSLFLIATILLTMVMSGCSDVKVIDKILGNLKSNTVPLTTLTFYYPSSTGGFDIRKDASIVHAEVERRAADLNIKLNFKAIPYGDFQKTTEAALEAGEPVDAILFRNPNSVIDFTKMARKGELADITELLPQYAPHIAQMLSEYGQDCIDVNGKTVGVPAIYPMVDYCYVSVREDFLKRYNIPDIKTFDDYEVYLKTVQENEGNVAPGWVGDQMVQIFAKPYGYEILDANQFLVYKSDDPSMIIRAWEQTPEFKESVNLITKWHKSGYIAENVTNEDLMNASKISSTMWFGAGDGSTRSYVGRDGIAMKSFPMYPDIKMTRVSVSDHNGAIAFNSHSPNIGRMLMFLDWVQKDQENYELFLYGIKGQHYNIEQGILKLPKGTTYYNSRYPAWEGSDAFLNVKWDRHNEVYSDDNLQYLKENSKYAPHEGFYPDYTNVEEDAKSRESIIYSDINNPLCTGGYINERTDDVIERLRTMGAEQIVNEVQQQIDEWRAKKK